MSIEAKRQKLFRLNHGGYILYGHLRDRMGLEFFIGNTADDAGSVRCQRVGIPNCHLFGDVVPNLLQTEAGTLAAVNNCWHWYAGMQIAIDMRIQCTAESFLEEFDVLAQVEFEITELDAETLLIKLK